MQQRNPDDVFRNYDHWKTTDPDFYDDEPADMPNEDPYDPPMTFEEPSDATT